MAINSCTRVFGNLFEKLNLWALSMNMRPQQLNYSSLRPSMFEVSSREKKAKTAISVLRQFSDRPLSELDLLDVGASTGIIDHILAGEFRVVKGLDIDQAAVTFARENFNRDNLSFEVGDAMRLTDIDGSFDVVFCSQVYEHVPSAEVMMKEIYRVLRPGGVCYFAANNRFMWNEPHYNLPLLSVVPRWLAHRYVRVMGKAERYHELHYSYWGLRGLVSKFDLIDYTSEIIRSPERFCFEHKIPVGSLKQKVALFVLRYLFWFVPGYIWILRKPVARAG